MPTVLVVNGFRFFFYSADGDEPAHVHVQKGSGDGKIWLKPETKIEYLVDFKSQEEKQILEIVNEMSIKTGIPNGLLIKCEFHVTKP